MLVQLFKFGQDEIVTTFLPGVHDLGRGITLKCYDKRVSRQHAILEVGQDVTLTSTHINPCFIRSEGSKTIRILKKDKSEELKDGDSFALLPEDFWFKVKIITDDGLDLNKITLKRSASSERENTSLDKKMKTENEEIKLDENVEKSINSTIQQETTENIVQENLSKQNENVNQPKTDDIKVEISAQTKDEEASTSENVNKEDAKRVNCKPIREKCWYAHECYRKNSQHRDELSHPGDSDFETDSQDNRPTCSYGTKCYRKNKQHRQDFKHPPRLSCGKKKRNRKKVDRLNVATSQELNELLDSETEDPFIDDADSDEYTQESDVDSDWQEDENDEESENMKVLMKEAKKFVNK